MPRTADDLAEEMVECVVHNALSGRELEDYVVGFMLDGPEDARAMLQALHDQRTGAYPVTVACDEERYRAIAAAIVRWERPRYCIESKEGR